MAVSEHGLSDRVSRSMNPEQAKRDEDVVHAMESWFDELRALSAMGVEDLAIEHQTAGIKKIATRDIRESLSKRETELKLKGVDKKSIFIELKELAMGISKTKAFESMDTKKVSGHTVPPVNMEVNGMNLGGGWNGWAGDQYNPPGLGKGQWDQEAYMVKGKGKN